MDHRPPAPCAGQSATHHGAFVHEQESRTALSWASQLGFVNVMRILLNNGASVDVADKVRMPASCEEHMNDG